MMLMGNQESQLRRSLILLLFLLCFLGVSCLKITLDNLEVIILARESGLKLELSYIPVQSLVPEPLRKIASAEEFLMQLPQFDSEMFKERQDAENAGETANLFGRISAGAEVCD